MNAILHRKTIIGVLAFTAIAVGLFLAKGEKFLRIESDDQNRRADAVVVLAGAFKEDKERIEAGTALMRQGKGTYLILPLRHAAVSWQWTVEYYGLRSDLPDARVLIGRSTLSDEPLINRFGGTYVEARKTVQIMRELDLRSAIIVSSAYHMRRAQMAFEQLRRSAGLDFYYHPVDASEAESKIWWLDTEYVVKILQEYKKLLAAFFIYDHNPQAVP